MASNLNPLIPLLLFMPQQRVAAIFSGTLLPNLIGGPVLAALFQDRELRRQEETDKTIIQQVVTADNLTDKDALKNKSEKLREVYDKLPEALRNEIQFVVIP